MIANNVVALQDVRGLATSNYYAIATVTGGTGTSITFSSIPSVYRALQIRYIGKSTNATDNSILITFNGDTATNYASHYLRGTAAGATAASGAASANNIVVYGNSFAGAGQTNFIGAGIIDIMDYASTAKNKTLRAVAGLDFNSAASSAIVSLNSGVWLSTAAINSITINNGGGAAFQGSQTYALYGVK